MCRNESFSYTLYSMTHWIHRSCVRPVTLADWKFLRLLPTVTVHSSLVYRCRSGMFISCRVISVSKHQDTVYNNNNNICSHVSLQINELFKHISTREINAKTDIWLTVVVLEVKLKHLLKWALNYFRLILLPSFIATLSFILSVHNEVFIKLK